MSDAYYEDAGSIGIASKTIFALFCHCGVTETDAVDLAEARAHFLELGFTDGHPVQTTAQLGLRGIDSEWRCEDCEEPCRGCSSRPRRYAKVGELCAICEDEGPEFGGGPESEILGALRQAKATLKWIRDSRIDPTAKGATLEDVHAAIYRAEKIVPTPDWVGGERKEGEA